MEARRGGHVTGVVAPSLNRPSVGEAERAPLGSPTRLQSAAHLLLCKRRCEAELVSDANERLELLLTDLILNHLALIVRELRVVEHAGLHEPLELRHCRLLCFGSHPRKG